ncbi:hypothetical protein BT63DRAFT_416337 [Microthyrium microscopicum]|uniref:Uncharacterized protein n=1 Tax=Microthyrium microscopicum TaxID=703497 RepID=A0A6A6U0Q8_9PEZI|nr:hypothetical protein BT63DRAFT_416337 [Microthyrium microscopicum]
MELVEPQTLFEGNRPAVLNMSTIDRNRILIIPDSRDEQEIIQYTNYADLGRFHLGFVATIFLVDAKASSHLFTSGSQNFLQKCGPAKSWIHGGSDGSWHKVAKDIIQLGAALGFSIEFVLLLTAMKIPGLAPVTDHACQTLLLAPPLAKDGLTPLTSQPYFMYPGKPDKLDHMSGWSPIARDGEEARLQLWKQLSQIDLVATADKKIWEPILIRYYQRLGEDPYAIYPNILQSLATDARLQSNIQSLLWGIADSLLGQAHDIQHCSGDSGYILWVPKGFPYRNPKAMMNEKKRVLKALDMLPKDHDENEMLAALKGFTTQDIVDDHEVDVLEGLSKLYLRE